MSLLGLKNTFHSWVPYPTMIPPTVSTIMRRSCNVPVTFHGLVLQSNHERLRLKRVDLRRICLEELLARIFQDVCDKVCDEWGDALSDDSNDVWLDGSESD